MVRYTLIPHLLMMVIVFIAFGLLPPHYTRDIEIFITMIDIRLDGAIQCDH
jgi:hypothetical protein